MQTDSTKGLNTQNAVERFVVFIWEVIQGTNIPNLAYVPNMTLVGANLPVGTFFPLHNDHFYPILQSFFDPPPPPLFNYLLILMETKGHVIEQI